MLSCDSSLVTLAVALFKTAWLLPRINRMGTYEANHTTKSPKIRFESFDLYSGTRHMAARYADSLAVMFFGCLDPSFHILYLHCLPMLFSHFCALAQARSELNKWEDEITGIMAQIKNGKDQDRHAPGWSSSIPSMSDDFKAAMVRIIICSAIW